AAPLLHRGLGAAGAACGAACRQWELGGAELRRATCRSPRGRRAARLGCPGGSRVTTSPGELVRRARAVRLGTSQRRELGAAPGSAWAGRVAAAELARSVRAAVVGDARSGGHRLERSRLAGAGHALGARAQPAAGAPGASLLSDRS